jgi:hypothetical protein
MKRLRVKLTLQQADQVEWALGPMEDFWCTDEGAHERGDRKYPANHLPILIPDGDRKTSKILELSQNDDINSDLLYRLEVQLKDMADEETGKDRGASKAGRNAALRIRHRRPSLTNLNLGGGWI